MSPGRVWDGLRARLADDVARFKELTGSKALTVTNTDRHIAVSYVGPMGGEQQLIVQPEENRLKVWFSGRTPEDLQEFFLVPKLNAKGECRLMHEDEELELWQASFRILVPLLLLP